MWYTNEKILLRKQQLVFTVSRGFVQTVLVLVFDCVGCYTTENSNGSSGRKNLSRVLDLRSHDVILVIIKGGLKDF